MPGLPGVFIWVGSIYKQGETLRLFQDFLVKK
jgi:hypothetical protein